MDFRQVLSERQKQINEAIVEMLDARFDDDRDAGQLYKAARHALMSGGKRLRPILLTSACELCGGRSENSMYAAVALEFIHTYSLIHDDLPAMDDADRRRGEPTVHKLFGEGMAVLAGDALLTEAFGILADVPGQDRLPEDRCLSVIRVVAQSSGVLGMVGGQELDLLSEGRDIDLATLDRLHYRKTSAMIEGALKAGAILGGGDEQQTRQLADYGKKIGLAFQIRDDLLDVEGDPDKMGKNIGGDAEHFKATYPAIAGIEASRLRMDSLISDAIAELETFGEKAWFLIALARLIGERNR